MPTISSFYGILIQMFWGDHAPPHFHALYFEHRDELLEDWELCMQNKTPKKISPLE